jgi:hypothetical protein
MEIFIMKDAMHGNPYHLFFYMIGQFKAFDDKEIVHYYYPKTDCVLAESALENLPKRFVREYTINESYKYIEPTMQSIECIDKRDEKWIFHFVRDLYKDIWSQFKRQKGKYTYISRSKAAVRRITNETYLPALTSMGVSVYCMEDLTFIDQIRLFAESELITGPHGAAYSFAIFCKPGTYLYEIYRADSIKGHYPILANECGLKYLRYTGIDHYDEQFQDMTIDVQTYLDSLEAVILSISFSGLS